MRFGKRAPHPEEVLAHCCFCDNCEGHGTEPITCGVHALFLAKMRTNSPQADISGSPAPQRRTQTF